METEGLMEKITQPFNLQDVDAVDEAEWEIVSEACKKAWFELEVKI